MSDANPTRLSEYADVTGTPKNAEEWEDLMQALDTEIKTLQEKCESGRIYDAENDRVRIKWHTRLLKALSHKKDVLKSAPSLNKSPPSSERVVYIIKGGQKHKVGVSSDVPRRMETLQNSSPLELSLVYKSNPLGAAEVVEHEIHEEYSEYRTHGEWFDIPDGHVGDVIRDIDVLVSEMKKSE